MEQRPFGRTGMSVSVLGFGCGNVGGLMVRGSHEDQVAAVKRALDAGITYFDTAAVYGNGLSEQHLGRVLKELDAWDSVRVGTKLRLGPDDIADPVRGVRAHMLQNLQRLDHDSVDLIQLHNNLFTSPTGDGFMAGVASERVAGVAEGMRALVREGLARHIGFTGLGETAAVHAAIDSGAFDSVQSYFNALNPSSGYAGVSNGSQDFGGVIDRAAAQGMGVIGIRVMAAGALVGTPERAPLASESAGDLVRGSEYDRDIERSQHIEPLARELGLESALELSFRFAIAKPGLSTALVGYSDMDQLEASIRWAERGPLGDDAVRRVLAALSN